jgi:thiamine pyrophosphate-dependent acetolactate synthase large subunit-like protein
MNPGKLNDLSAAVDILAGAPAPVILVGSAARPFMHRVRAIALQLGAAILTTPDAVSICGPAGCVSQGSCSFGATDRARDIASASRVVLAVCKYGEFAGQSGKAFPHASVIHVADDPADLCIARPAAVTFVGDVEAILGKLLDALPIDTPRSPWFDALPAPPAAPPRERAPWRGMDPEDAMRAIVGGLPPDARVACDITTAALVLLQHPPQSPDVAVWLQITETACMGAALSAGLGVRIASERPTLVLAGDWGATTAAGELATVATLAPSGFVVVVWGNAGGAMIRNGVRHQGLQVPTGMHTWPTPRFAQIAEGFGLRGVTARTADALRDAVREGMNARTPVLVSAVIDPEAEISGAVDRFEVLEKSGGPR